MLLFWRAATFQLLQHWTDEDAELYMKNRGVELRKIESRLGSFDRSISTRYLRLFLTRGPAASMAS
jgi:hypothetical protein